MASTRADLQKRVLEIVAVVMSLKALPYGVSEILSGLDSCKKVYEQILEDIAADAGFNVSAVPELISKTVVDAAMWLDRGKLQLKQEELAQKQALNKVKKTAPTDAAE